MKKRIVVSILTVLSLLVALSVPAKAEAATKKEKAFKAYYKEIKEISSPDSPSGGFEMFQLIYVNKDSVPELLAAHFPKDEYENNGIIEYALFTYADGKVVTLGGFSSGVASAGGYRGNTSYIKKSGLVFETYISAGSGKGSDIVYKMKGGELVKKASGDFDIAEGTYKWKNKTVSEKTYTKRLEKAYNSKKAVSFEEIEFISYKDMRKKLKG